jgi:hypothetical protein
MHGKENWEGTHLEGAVDVVGGLGVEGNEGGAGVRKVAHDAVHGGHLYGFVCALVMMVVRDRFHHGPDEPPVDSTDWVDRSVDHDVGARRQAGKHVP